VKTTRLRVVLRDVEPALARVIDVPASATLPELHELLQAAIGWTDSHLHQFVTPQATYGMEIPGEEVWPEDQRDETGAHLADLGAEFEYLYDFGDGWTHDVEVLGPGGQGLAATHGTEPKVMIVIVTDAPAPVFDWTAVALLAWLGGALAFLAWRIVTYRWMRQDLLDGARTVGEVGKIRLVETPAVDSPVATTGRPPAPRSSRLNRSG